MSRQVALEHDTAYIAVQWFSADFTTTKRLILENVFSPYRPTLIPEVIMLASLRAGSVQSTRKTLKSGQRGMYSTRSGDAYPAFNEVLPRHRPRLEVCARQCQLLTESRWGHYLNTTLRFLRRCLGVRDSPDQVWCTDPQLVQSMCDGCAAP